MTKNANQFLNNKPVKIGITGLNNNNGMGDLTHILNVGQALSREGVTDVTYHINWSLVDFYNEELINRTANANRLN
ncbi:MAG: hypothetical protein RCG15_00815 [Candidatus Rickettsia vulgarisii]